VLVTLAVILRQMCKLKGDLCLAYTTQANESGSLTTRMSK
jgi:hypothetical protein